MRDHHGNPILCPGHKCVFCDTKHRHRWPDDCEDATDEYLPCDDCQDNVRIYIAPERVEDRDGG